MFLQLKPYDEMDVKPARIAFVGNVTFDNVKRYVVDIITLFIEMMTFVFEGYVAMFSSLVGKVMNFRKLKGILRRGYKFKLWSSAGHKVRFIKVPLNLLKTDALMNEVFDIQNQLNASADDNEIHDSLELINETATKTTQETTDIYDVKITMSWVYGNCLSGDDLSLREFMGKQKDDEEVMISKHGKNEIDQDLGIVEDLSDITLNNENSENQHISPVTITITNTVDNMNDDMDWISLVDNSAMDESIKSYDDSAELLPRPKHFRKRRLSRFLKRLNCFTSSKVKQ